MKSLTSAVTAISLVFSMSVFAGYTQPAPVQIIIDTTPGEEVFYADGDMGTARFAENDVENIGCGIKKFVGFEFGFCQATDADDQRVVCVTEDLNLLEAIYAVNDTSYIQFNWTPGVDPETGDPTLDSGDCTRIGISSQSFYIIDGKNTKK